jgi:hypothetical protein
MAFQDWNQVVLKKNNKTEEEKKNNNNKVFLFNEAQRLAKLDAGLPESNRKRIQSDSLQELIRRRIELKLTQEKADNKCAFPRHTFRDLEGKKVVPTQHQQSSIQKQFGIQLRIESF